MKQAFGRTAGLGLVICALSCATAGATDLYKPGNWPALASDRPAEKVGDSLTVLIQEQSQAYDTTQNVTQGGAGVTGQDTAGSYNKNGQLNVSGNYKVTGQHGRTGQLVAQISVVVDSVLPNGDLHVTGDQTISINGRKTEIHLNGRVRLADISPANTVMSSSLADATIVYGGHGPVQKVFSWLGL